MADTITPVEDFWRGQTETETFNFFEQTDTSDERAKSLKESEADLRELMSSREEAKRLAVAERILKDGKADLGVAHVVVARAAANLAEKEKHYRAALEASANHKYKATGKDGDNSSDMLNAAIAMEFADLLWRNSKTEAAIDVLQPIQDRASELRLQQHIRDALLTALTTYMILDNRDADARALLEIDPIPMADWYYLNALLKFKEMGDCIQSRSALSTALNDNLIVAVNLSSEDEDLDAEDLMTDWDYHYSQITLPAWQQTEGAMDWLCDVFDTKRSLFGAEDAVDEVRYKKWQREMEVAEAHIRREDFKSIKRSFKMALREAESLNDGGDMFLLTAKMLATVLLENGNSLDDLKESFDKKIAWLDKQDSDDYESLFTSYSHFAKTLYEIGMVKQAKHCAKKAIDLYEKAMERKSDQLDYFYLAECLIIHASLHSVEENFEEAERAFSRLVSTQEEFLGPKHLNLVDGLAGHRFCLHQLKRHEEEKDVHDRLRTIDLYFDADDEYKFVCDAVPAEAR